MVIDQTARVLCVDDDELTLDLFGKYLQMQGLSPVLAIDGVQALSLLKDHTSEIKLVFLDLALPHFDGYQVAAAIMASDQWSGIPIVVVTAHIEPWVVEKLRGLGVTEVISKPFHPKRLRDALVAHGILA
jgi:chemosensory pili system protein ChpA (sensor histidine kinase/response regulator)